MSAQTEYALIGALLIDPEAIVEVAQSVESEDFGDARARMIYAAILRLYRAGKPCHFVRIADEMDRSGELARVGAAFLWTVASACPQHLYVADYTEMVARDGAERRGQTGRLPFKGSVRL